MRLIGVLDFAEIHLAHDSPAVEVLRQPHLGQLHWRVRAVNNAQNDVQYQWTSGHCTMRYTPFALLQKID